VHGLAQRLRWPVLADPRSRCRVPGTIAAADAIVRAGAPLPETVVLLGSPWLSRALGEYVASAAARGARIVVVDTSWQWSDPNRVATEFVHGDAYAARHDVTVVAAASMPIRDLEWFAEAVPVPPRVLVNRGVNGIDGITSTALGVATAEALAVPGHRTIALLGDLAFLHDVSGLVNLADSVPCTFVVLDNRGGGIFSFLPQAGTLAPEVFEQLFGTPPSSDIGAVARGFGLPVREVTSLDQLEPALRGSAPALVRVMVPERAENVAVHDAVNRAVRLALT
jgi:2-succinyl-5-enolpyruvyl-6-hydroxy-3-cyclohexene-1-carboxylate synthase